MPTRSPCATRLRAAAAVLVTAAAGGLLVLAPQAPAGAAACSSASGVTVVVEPGALGGGTKVDCLADGGGRTAKRLLEALYRVTYVQRFPGFVCRIDGAPADDPCVNTPPADAYWGLWWSDGKSGKWSYSSLGVSSLNIPDGGYLALVWDGSSGDVRPSTPATAHREPSPTPTPTKKPTTKAPTPTPSLAPTPTTQEATPGASTGKATPSASPTKKPKPSKTASSAAASGSPDTSTPSSDAPDQQTEAGAPIEDPIDPQSATDDGLPPWVAPLAVVVLLGAAGSVALARRRHQP